MLTQNNSKTKYNILTAVFIVIFVCSLTVQSIVSFSESITVRTEFATQAGLYFLTLCLIAACTTSLVKIIREMFGTVNEALENEIQQVQMALRIFAFSYVVRVFRNTILVLFWDPCFTVNNLIETSSLNLLFYVVCDFIPVAFMLRMH